MRKNRLGLLTAISYAVLSGTALAAPYTFTTITIPGITAFSPTGINDVGQIIGVATINNFAQDFVETLSTGDTLVFRGSYALQTNATGINNEGGIVGYSVGSGISTPFIRDPSTGLVTNLNFSNVAFSGNNDLGQAVGHYVLELHNGPISTASFIYDISTGTMTIFATPPGGATFYPTDINNHDQVVGQLISNSGDTTSAVVDVASNTFTLINVPGSTATRANGLNDAGQVVGNDTIGSTTTAFLFDLSTGLYTTVTGPGATLSSATGINNAGQIVGFGVDSAGKSAELLATPAGAGTPVPEPASLALVLGGLSALAATRRTRHPKLA